MRNILSTLVAVALMGPAHAAFADDSAANSRMHDEMKQAHRAIGALKQADPGLARFFGSAVGYAVFPTVGKGAVGIGGAHGTGVLYESGAAIGKAILTQVTVGLQLGGQAAPRSS